MSFDLDVEDLDALLGPSNFTERIENEILHPSCESIQKALPIKGRSEVETTSADKNNILTKSTTTSSSSNSSSSSSSSSSSDYVGAQGQIVYTLGNRDNIAVDVSKGNKQAVASLTKMIDEANHFKISQDHRHDLCARILNHPEINQKLTTYLSYNGEYLS